MDPPPAPPLPPSQVPLNTIEEINPIAQQPQETKNSSNSQVTQPSLKLPCGDLLGSRDDYIKICVPLYYASMNGDWETAQVILGERQELVRFSINENCDTVLHIAASAKRSTSVENFAVNLVNQMEKEDLELQNKNSNNALCLAAASGNINIVKAIVEKHKDLLDIPGSKNMMPLYMACLYGKSEMVNYLYDNSNKMTGESWTHQKRGWVLEKCVEANLYDVALKIVIDREELATSNSLLGILARKTNAFTRIKPNFMCRVINKIIHVTVGPAEKPSDAMRLLRIVWTNTVKLPKRTIDNILRGPEDDITLDEKTTPHKQRQEAVELLETISENIMKLPVRHYNLFKRSTDQIVQEEKATSDVKSNKYARAKRYSSRVLFVAAEMGNTEFVGELFRQYPDLIYKTDDNNHTVFHVAVSHRQVGVYNILHEIGSMKDMITPLKDIEGNNMLHLAGKRAKETQIQAVSSVALQLQQELLWYKEVESIMPPSYCEKKNNDGLRPRELFTMEHKDLVTTIEKWMKDAANQCLVVAALIASVGFAAVFTVPGGYDQVSGIPMFLQKRSFIIFIISDGISLTFSSISILIFLSFFTSRYIEPDFVESLPKKLMRGLATLFLSITSMLIAFSVNIFVLYQNKLIWLPILMGIFTSIPVILYARLQFDLLKDVYQSTYGSKTLFKSKKPMLYYQNPRV